MWRGLFTADPNRNPDARFIGLVTAVTPEIEAMAGRSASTTGSGRYDHQDHGRGKLPWPRAVTCASRRGITRIRYAGWRRARRCTWFAPTETPVAARKQ